MEANPKLEPGAAIIYERSNDVVYGRYRDPPHNTKPRWIVGGSPSAVAQEKGMYLDYREWLDLCELSESHPTLKCHLEKLIDIYTLVKEQT